MPTIQALREQREVVARQMHDLLSENPGDKWTPAIGDKFDAMEKQITAIDDEISRVQRVQDLLGDEAASEAVSESIAKAKENHQDLFSRWVRGGDKALSAEDWMTIQNTLSVGTPSEGGYTVQTEVARTVADALKAYGGMRQVSTIIQTSGVGDINYPTSDGTSEVGELVQENTTATAADPTFGVVTLKAYKFSSKVSAAPFELLQDSNTDIQAFILNRLAQRLGRAQNAFFTTGTGTNQPRGILTAATAGKTGATGQTGTLIFDDLVDLIHSVDPAYRAGTCGFMMHDSTLRAIRKLKDTSGRPVFIPGFDGMANPMADSILGYPVTINQDMPVMAASAKPLLFGDFSRYVIRDVMGMTMFRFEDSAYVKLGQIGFLAWMRAGGTLIDVGGAVKYYQNSAT